MLVLVAGGMTTKESVRLVSDLLALMPPTAGCGWAESSPELVGAPRSTGGRGLSDRAMMQLESVESPILPPGNVIVKIIFH